jgi:hypothetical protein
MPHGVGLRESPNTEKSPQDSAPSNKLISNFGELGIPKDRRSNGDSSSRSQPNLSPGLRYHFSSNNFFRNSKVRYVINQPIQQPTKLPQHRLLILEETSNRRMSRNSLYEPGRSDSRFSNLNRSSGESSSNHIERQSPPDSHGIFMPLPLDLKIQESYGGSCDDNRLSSFKPDPTQQTTFGEIHLPGDSDF